MWENEIDRLSRMYLESDMRQWRANQQIAIADSIQVMSREESKDNLVLLLEDY